MRHDAVPLTECPNNASLRESDRPPPAPTNDGRDDLPPPWPEDEPGSASSITVPVSTPPTAVPGPHPLPQLPGYDVLDKVGRGGMGVVYKARQLSPNRIVALKMLLAGSHADLAARRRFEAEAAAVARLEHPNVVRLYAVGSHDGQPFFSLEFVAGGGLDRKLSGIPQPARESAALVERLARAMQHVHEQGIVHRDLKPANVLLTADGTPKITDFGLAKSLAEGAPGETPSRAVLGTPSYMAPEQAKGTSRSIGPTADVYALGAILYECLTGRPPFRGVTQVETIHQVIHNEPLPPTRLQPQVPRDLETICLKCLRKEPQQRYASAGALAEDLRRFSAGEPIAARPVGRLVRAGKWIKRNPGKAATLAALVLAVVGLALWQLAVRQRLHALEQEDAADYAAARAQLAAERYADAAEIVERARKRLANEPALDAARPRWQRLQGLVGFFSHSEEAWFRAGEERYEEGRTASETALRQLGILGDDGAFRRAWWDGLGATDLSPEQQTRLHEEVYRQLLLLTYLRTAPWLQPKTLLSPPACAAYRSALLVLEQARVHERAVGLPHAQTVDVFATFLQDIRRAAGEPAPVVAQPTGPVEPNNAIDHFFSGAVHYYLYANKQATLLRWMFSSWRAYLDFNTPGATAEDRLRDAARLDPRRFWTYFMLGETLQTAGKHEQAELAFNTCVALRPDYPVSYQLRALALCYQAQKLPAKEHKRRAQLVERALRDAGTALKVANKAGNPAVYWSRGEMFILLKDAPQALDAFATGLQRDPELEKKINRSKVLKRVEKYAESVLKHDTRPVVGATAVGLIASPLGEGPFLAAPLLLAGKPRSDSGKATAHAVLALLYLTRNETVRAETAAQQALAIDPQNRHARAVLKRLGQ